MISWDSTHGYFYWFPFVSSFNFRRFHTEPRLPLCGPNLLMSLSCVRETTQILQTDPIEEAEASWAVRGDYSTGQACMDLPACVEVYWKVIWTLSMSKRKFYVWYQWKLCSSKFRITKIVFLSIYFVFLVNMTIIWYAHAPTTFKAMTSLTISTVMTSSTIQHLVIS